MGCCFRCCGHPGTVGLVHPALRAVESCSLYYPCHNAQGVHWQQQRAIAVQLSGGNMPALSTWCSAQIADSLHIYSFVESSHSFAVMQSGSLQARLGCLALQQVLVGYRNVRSHCSGVVVCLFVPHCQPGAAQIWCGAAALCAKQQMLQPMHMPGRWPCTVRCARALIECAW